MDDISLVTIGIIVIIFFLIAEFFGRSKHIGKWWTFVLLLTGVIPGLFALIFSPSANRKPTKGNIAHKVFGVLLVISGLGNLFMINKMPEGFQNPSVKFIPVLIILGNYMIRLSTGKIINQNPKFYFGSRRHSNISPKFQRTEFQPEAQPETQKNGNAKHEYSFSKSFENLKDLREIGVLTESEYDIKIIELKSREASEQLETSKEFQQLKELFEDGLLTKIEFESKVQILKNNFTKTNEQNYSTEDLIKFMDYELNYGFKDEFDTIIIKPVFEFAEDFKEGFALVRLNRRFGFIDRSGVVVIQIIYDNGESFEDGKALVRLNGRQFYIDKRGSEIG